jgi:DNA-binding NarL/FixJ family response regulator
MVLLIAEDSFLLRERLVKSILKFNPDLEILEASTGREAIRIASEKHIDCAILDIALPDISGIKVLKFFRCKNLDVKTIMFTNYPKEEFKEICLKSGANYFFEKYQNFKEVIKLVADLANENKSSSET